MYNVDLQIYLNIFISLIKSWSSYYAFQEKMDR